MIVVFALAMWLCMVAVAAALGIMMWEDLGVPGDHVVLSILFAVVVTWGLTVVIVLPWAVLKSCLPADTLKKEDAE